MSRYIVVSDPPGVKVGSGGSTLQGLDQLLTILGHGALKKCRYLNVYLNAGASEPVPQAPPLRDQC